MKLFEKLAKINSVSGNEKEMKSFIAEEVKKLCSKIYEDNFGNLICVMGEGEEKIMFNAPISENGFFITDIKNGKAKVSPMGSFAAEGLVGKIAVTEKGVEGIFVSPCGDDEKKPTADKFEIDFFGNEEVKNGETVAIKGKARFFGDCAVCSAAGIKAGIYAMINIMKSIKATDKEIYFVFSVQDNLGFKGAKVAAQEINPSKAVVIGSASTGNKETKIEAGKGAVIRLKDKAAVFGKAILCELSDIVDLSSMQKEICKDSAITNNNIMFLNSGIPAVNINIPVKYADTFYETVCLKDADALVRAIRI